MFKKKYLSLVENISQFTVKEFIKIIMQVKKKTLAEILTLFRNNWPMH